MDNPKNYESLLLLEKKYAKPFNKIPVIFIGADVVGGKTEILSKLPGLIEKYKKIGKCDEVLPAASENFQKKEVLQKIKLIPIIIAGITDSVNPCAFATLVFFITYLSMVLKKKKGEIIFIGLGFIVGVFISYFLIGFGLFRFLHQSKQVFVISKITYILIGVIAIIISLRHFYEAIKIKKGRQIADSTMKLRLSNKLRWRIYDIISKYSKSKYIVIAAFVMGFFITLIEFACTGQIYLPTIIYIIRQPDFQTIGIFYLLLYCFLFVLPLFFVFGTFYFGLSIDYIEEIFRNKIYIIKILMSAVLFVLGLAIIFIT